MLRRGSMCVSLLTAPWSFPAGQTERLEAKAQVCDSRLAPGWRHILGSGDAPTVGEKHPPAAHCSQLRLFRCQDPIQTMVKDKEKEC